jgi:hypothetical protein
MVDVLPRRAVFIPDIADIADKSMIPRAFALSEP